MTANVHGALLAGLLAVPATSWAARRPAKAKTPPALPQVEGIARVADSVHFTLRGKAGRDDDDRLLLEVLEEEYKLLSAALPAKTVVILHRDEAGFRAATGAPAHLLAQWVGERLETVPSARLRDGQNLRANVRLALSRRWAEELSGGKGPPWLLAGVSVWRARLAESEAGWLDAPSLPAPGRPPMTPRESGRIIAAMAGRFGPRSVEALLRSVAAGAPAEDALRDHGGVALTEGRRE